MCGVMGIAALVLYAMGKVHDCVLLIVFGCRRLEEADHKLQMELADLEMK